MSSVTTKSFTGKISTSKQFGLITTSCSTIQLTDTCKRLLYPTGNDIYSIKHACFSQPPLYNKLIAIYDGKALPSEEILSNILMTEHRIAKAVKNNAAKCFLESAGELGLIKGGILCYAESEKNFNTENSIDNVNDILDEDVQEVVQEKNKQIKITMLIILRKAFRLSQEKLQKLLFQLMQQKTIYI